MLKLNEPRYYPSELSLAQWNYIKVLIPEARSGGRPRTTNIKSVLDAILYLVNTGCAWRYLPKEYPPWKTVYDYFWHWSYQGVWRKIHDALVAMVRELSGRSRSPSYFIIDSQSIKATSGEQRAYDGFKKVRGRKRHILVDTLGFIHAINIHSADLSDTKEGSKVLDDLSQADKRSLKVLNADMGYLGTFVREYKVRFHRRLLIKRRKNTGQGRRKSAIDRKHWRKVRRKIRMPKRWIVERTFAWFNNYRRLTRDYEKTVRSSTMVIYLAMTELLLRRCFD